MSKKGVSTVEIIVSFTIFLTFVLFIFLYLNPVKHDILPSLFAALEAGLKKESNVELTELPFVVSAGMTESCFQIQISNVLNLSKGNVSVMDADDNVLSHGISASGNEMQIQKKNRLYRLLQSPEIPKASPLTGCKVLNQNDYAFSVERAEMIYSYKKLVEINKSYYIPNEYTNLKKRFDFPITSDFAISIASDNFNITMAKNIPPAVEIKSRRYPIQILQDDVRKSATLSLVVW